MTNNSVEIGLLDEDEVKAVSKVLAAMMEKETDYDHLRPLLDAWYSLHEAYSRVYFFTDKPTVDEVETAVNVVKKAQDLDRKDIVLSFIDHHSDPSIPEEPRALPDYEGEVVSN